jgi:hypothetical protein
MIRPIQEIHTKVALIKVGTDLDEIVKKEGVLLWNLEGRWGLVTAPILANAYSSWRDHNKMRDIAPHTPAREFWIGWSSALAVPPEVAKSLITESQAPSVDVPPK